MWKGINGASGLRRRAAVNNSLRQEGVGQIRVSLDIIYFQDTTEGRRLNIKVVYNKFRVREITGCLYLLSWAKYSRMTLGDMLYFICGATRKAEVLFNSCSRIYHARCVKLKVVYI